MLGSAIALQDTPLRRARAGAARIGAAAAAGARREATVAVFAGATAVADCIIANEGAMSVTGAEKVGLRKTTGKGFRILSNNTEL